MKKFFKEFKQFISRGNVIDMAVGIIIGGAFTAIVNALVKYILTPLINWIPGADNTGALQVVLREAVTAEDGSVITPALIIDFGEVISAIITFIITAFVLFLIIKAVNSLRDAGAKVKEKKKKKKKGEEPAEEQPAPEPVVEAAPVQPAPTTEELLAEIRDLLKQREVVDTVSVKNEENK